LRDAGLQRGLHGCHLSASQQFTAIGQRHTVRSLERAEHPIKKQTVVEQAGAARKLPDKSIIDPAS
jgi:hypothetical protein